MWLRPQALCVRPPQRRLLRCKTKEGLKKAAGVSSALTNLQACAGLHDESWPFVLRDSCPCPVAHHDSRGGGGLTRPGRTRRRARVQVMMHQQSWMLCRSLTPPGPRPGQVRGWTVPGLLVRDRDAGRRRVPASGLPGCQARGRTRWGSRAAESAARMDVATGCGGWMSPPAAAASQA
jgi:hypothetical protein